MCAAELCAYAWLFEQVLEGQWKDRILGGARLSNELHAVNQVFDCALGAHPEVGGAGTGPTPPSTG